MKDQNVQAAVERAVEITTQECKRMRRAGYVRDTFDIEPIETILNTLSAAQLELSTLRASYKAVAESFNETRRALAETNALYQKALYDQAEDENAIDAICKTAGIPTHDGYSCIPYPDIFESLVKEIAELKRDKERLDWLDGFSTGNYESPYWKIYPVNSGQDLREALDSAMTQQKDK